MKPYRLYRYISESMYLPAADFFLFLLQILYKKKFSIKRENKFNLIINKKKKLSRHSKTFGYTTNLI